jgi:hypothetical protein
MLTVLAPFRYDLLFAFAYILLVDNYRPILLGMVR